MSPSTMQRLLKSDLKVKPYKITKRQLLSEATKNKRFERANLLLKKLLDDTQPTVLWTDEKLFTVQAIHNSQNDRVWTKNRDSVPVENRTSFRRQKPASVMVWAGVTSSGQKSPLIFVEDGVKINQHAYLDMLRDKVLPWVDSLPGDEGVTLQQDGLPLTQQNWSKLGAKRISSPFGQRSSGLHLPQILIRWTLGYGRFWSRKPVLSHTPVLKLLNGN